MSERQFKPAHRYLGKLMMTYTFLALVILLGTLLLAGLISLDDQKAARVTFLVLAIPNFIFWIGAMLLCGPYYRSLTYEIHDDEVIVHVGVITHSIKHVPYRTVTNLSVDRDIFDRWFFNLGSLKIQTAGMSGQKGAEEQLVGMDNVDEVYQLVAAELRRFRGGMSPTQAEEEIPLSEVTDQAILQELRQIKEIIKNKN